MSRACWRATAAVFLALIAALPSHAQRAAEGKAPEFVFADVLQARDVLGARYDYV